MSTAAERPSHDPAPESHKPRRKRKANRAETSLSRRYVGIIMLGAVNVVLLPLAAWGLLRVTRPEPKVESPATPPAVASAPESRDRTETPNLQPIIPPAPNTPQPSAPKPPLNNPPPVNDDFDDPPPMKEPPKPEPPPAEKPKPDNPPPPAPKPPEPPPTSSRAYKVPTELELLKQVANFNDFGLTPGARQSMAASYQTEYQLARRSSNRPIASPSTLLNYFPSAGQLPLRGASICELSPVEAFSLGELSRKLHAYLALIAPFDATGKRKEPTKLREVLRSERRGKRPEWLRPEAVPAISQILMHEDVPLRLLMVELFSEINGPQATIKLAQRAVFDLSPEVRQEAIAALRDRPRELMRPIFINAFRYPWVPAARHAAEAVAALGDKDIAPLLVAQLAKPDPAMPYNSADGRTMVREVVRINHVENCLVCHVPAFSGRDPVTGVDPVTARPGVTLENPNTNYGKPIVTQNRSGIWGNNILIRADVQFLRQDFSVTFPLKSVFGSLQAQRFDFVVRTRPMKGEELREWKKNQRSPSESYPQRESVLAALRKVTGRDEGSATEAWVKAYPHAGAEAEGLRIVESLNKTGRDNLDYAVGKLRDAKDESVTDGLAKAIPHIGGKLQTKVREALVVRLSRQTTEHIRTRLQDDDDEMRHAAGLACVRRADPASVPDLIELLLDEDTKVSDGARKALQILTDQDFFPPDDTSPAARASAAARWQSWLQNETQP